MVTFETVVGLEIHIQLQTASKAFSREPNGFGQSVNGQLSAVTLALPGTLPRTNVGQVHKAVKLALACGSKVSTTTMFDRKNYFYPDLPKGFQTTQDKQPIGIGGAIAFETAGTSKTIRIHHLHMEEDAGKMVHDQSESASLVDLNRAGSPLIELVTEPDFRSGQEVHDFIAYMQQLVQYLDISDGNMEEGNLRADCNVSIRPLGSQHYGERCEIKNVNSKRFAKQAVDYEAQRQAMLLQAGGVVERATLQFNANNGTTKPMRKKESENDYRYFPEPDLPPIHLTDDVIAHIKNSIDWLPDQLRLHLVQHYGLRLEDATLLCQSKANALTVCRWLDTIGGNHKALIDLVVQRLLPMYPSLSQLTPNIALFQEMFDLIETRKVAKSAAYQQLVVHLFDQDLSLSQLAKELGIYVETEAADTENIDEAIALIIEQNPDKVKAYQKGQKGLLGFFMGQLVQTLKQPHDPKKLNEALSRQLEVK